MSSILKIEFWKDTGFQEGSVEVPSAADFLADPDYTYAPSSGNVKTSTEDFFSAFTIPVHFVALQPYSYIRVSYDYNVATPQGTYKQEYYGWIDDVSIKSDTQSNPSTRVSWHVDLWRTYLSQAQFGSGMVVRRPPSDNDPPNPVNAINLFVHDKTPLMSNSGVHWAMVNITAKIKDSKVTTIRTMVYPVDTSSPTTNMQMRLTSSASYQKCPSWEETVTSAFDEAYRLDPDSMYSAYLLPICPWGDSWTRDGNSVTLFGSTERRYKYYNGSMDSQTLPYVTNMHGAGETRPTVNMIFTGNTAFKSEFYNWSKIGFGVADTRIEDWRYNVFGVPVPFDGSFRLRLAVGSTAWVATDAAPLLFIPLDKIEQKAGVGLSQDGSLTLTGVLGYAEDGRWDVSGDNMGDDPSVPALQDFVVSADKWHGAVYDEGRLVIPGSERSKVKYIVALAKPESITYSIKTTLPYVGDVGIETVGEYCYAFSTSGSYNEYSGSVAETGSTDERTVLVTDFNNVPVATLPWGRTVSSYTMRPVVTQSSAYIQFRFDGPDSASEGMEVTIPLPALPITSNSWSSYVYSGARDSDIAQRKAEAENALVGGIMSSVTGGTSNAIMATIGYKGATTEKRYRAYEGTDEEGDHFSQWYTSYERALKHAYDGSYVEARTFPVKGVGVNPAAALGASIGVGAAASALEYANTIRQNGVLQGITDSAVSRQADNIITDGSGMDWLRFGSLPSLVTMVPDAYSSGRWSGSRSMNGVPVSEMNTDCTSLVAAGGPLRISELVVKGPIPVQARAHIKGRFANGVRIRTINHQETEDR